MSNSLRPYGLQYARPPRPSPTPRAYSNSCPLSQWCHPTISSSVVPFSSCLQSFPALTLGNSSACCFLTRKPVSRKQGSPLGLWFPEKPNPHCFPYPDPCCAPTLFSRSESLSATAHKTWHQRPVLLTGSCLPLLKQNNNNKKHLSRTWVKEQPRRGHWSLSPGLSGFGTGRGQSFPDVPLKGWTGARGALQIYKEMPVPQVCTMRNQKLSEESHCPSGQGLPRAFWLFLLSSLTACPWPPPSSGSPPLPRHTLLQPSQAHTFPPNYQLWFP